MARLDKRPSQKQRELMPTTYRHFDWPGVHVALYAPWWAPSRKKRELGFMVRVRDPRARCQHRTCPAWLDDGQAWCPLCGEKLRVKPKTLRIIQSPYQPRWRWLKVFVAKTAGHKQTRHGVVLAEIETHLTDGITQRITTKVFARLKMGFGGPSV